MGLFDPTQNVLQAAMSGAALREQVLANNVANANTPQFTRSDVNFQGAIQQALQSGTPVDSLQFSPQLDTTSPVSLDGNNVNVDSEMSQLSENTIMYQSFAQLAGTQLQMIDNVAKGT